MTVTGLPEGLTIDENLAIHGTLATPTALAAPYHVNVTIENETLDYTYTYTFDWLVRRVPTLAELNDGSAPGTPILAGILDPQSYPTVRDFFGVTYQHGATEHEVVYFRVYTNFGGALWQYDNGNISQVDNIDATHSLPAYSYSLARIPGHGMIFNDSLQNIWLADETGARVISTEGFYIKGDAISAGGASYLPVYKYDSSSSQYVDSLLKIEFDEFGAATVTNVPDTAGAQEPSAFAGGIIYYSYNSSTNVTTLKWLDPVSGLSREIIASAPGNYIAIVGVASGPGGTENLFYIASSEQTELCVLNSAELQSATPVSTTLATLDRDPNSWAVVDSQLVFMTTVFTEDGEANQAWISDGTVAGTQAVGQPFLGYSYYVSQISDQAVLGTDLYFAYYLPLDFEAITPTTIVSQIWKLDTVSRTLTSVVDFHGDDFRYSPNELIANGDRLYFATWDAAREQSNLWVYVPGVGASIVQQKADNRYINPEEIVSIGGSLYFAAQSESVVDIYGYPAYQPWVLVPATPEPGLPGDFNHDNTVDASDYVSLRKNGGTPEDFTAFRANFGRSLPAGGSGTSLHVEEEGADSTSSPASAPATGNTLETVAIPPAPTEVLPHDLSSTAISFTTSPAEDSTASAPLSPSQSDSTPAPRFFGTADTYKPVFTRVSRANISVADSIGIDLDELLLAVRSTSWIDDFVGEASTVDHGEDFDADSADASRQSIDEAFADFAVTLD